LSDDAAVIVAKAPEKVQAIQARRQGGWKRLNPELLSHSAGAFDDLPVLVIGREPLYMGRSRN